MSNSGAREGPAKQDAAAPKQPAPTEPVRRGRGRPKKHPQEPTGPPTPKRPRGRPIGSKNKEPRAVQKKAEPPRVKRPRGRPRKWPQRTQQEEQEETQQEEAGEGAEAPSTSGGN